MATIILLGILSSLVAFAFLPRWWQRLAAGLVMALLGFPLLECGMADVRGVVLTSCEMRIERPMKQLLIEIRDADPARSKALAAHMVENWDRIGIRQSKLGVEEVWHEFEVLHPDPDVQTEVLPEKAAE